jgi:hypothetical protein
MILSQLTCQLCQRECKNFKSLGTHLIKEHKTQSEYYYNKFIKKENILCKICKQTTKYINLSIGYAPTCSRACSRKLMNTTDARNKAKQTIMNKYGVEHYSKTNEHSHTHSKFVKKYFSDLNNRKKISILTKIAMKREDVKQNHLNAVRKPKSQETIEKQSNSARLKFINNPDIKNKIYTPQRNKKISIAKKKYWEEHPERKIVVGNIWKKVKEKDECKWREHLLSASKKGFEKIFKHNGETSLEIKIYKFLDDNNIKYKKQYELNYKLFDAYLIDYDILLEFDGDFWHKQTLEECKYNFKKESYYNDIHKNEIAKKYNIPLYRIKETDSPAIVLDVINQYKK